MSDQVADQYYTRFRGKMLGPFGIAQLRLMIERNQVTRLHELSPDGEVWKRLRDMPELRPGGAPPPPHPVDGDTQAEADAPARATAPIDLSALAPADNAPAPVRRLAGQNGVEDASADPRWYYARGERKVGPVTAAMLRTMAQQRKLDPQTLVWCEGMQEWQALGEVMPVRPDAPTLGTAPRRVVQPGTKPRSFTVFGILNLIFSALALLGSFSTFAPLADPMDPNNPLSVLAHRSDGYALTLVVVGLLNFVQVGLVIAGGVGLLNGRAWGRTLSISYAWITIGVMIAGTIASALFVMPYLQGASSAEVSGFVGGLVGVACLNLAYPIVLLSFMNRQVVKDYLMPQA